MEDEYSYSLCDEYSTINTHALLLMAHSVNVRAHDPTLLTIAEQRQSHCPTPDLSTGLSTDYTVDSALIISGDN